MIINRQLVRHVVMSLVIATSLFGIAAAQEIIPTVTVRVDGMGQDSIEAVANLHPNEYLRVELTAASGTGYEWKLVADPKLARVYYKSGPEPVDPNPALLGGPYRIVYTLQAGEEPGTESIRFILARSWEEDKLAAKRVSINMTINRQPDSKP